MKMRTLLLSASFLALSVGIASAQPSSGIQRIGPVTTGNCVEWANPSAVRDAGASCGSSGSGDVVGPASSVNGNLVIFSGTSGKLIQDGGIGLSALAPAGEGEVLTADETVTAANFNQGCKLYTINGSGIDITMPAANTLQPNGGCLFINNPSGNTWQLIRNGSDTINGVGGNLTVSAFSNTAVTTDGASALFAGTGTIAPALANITGFGTGVATLLGGTASGTGGPAGTASPTFTGTISAAAATLTGTLTTNITGSTQCVQANSSGVLSGTGSACGGGGGSGTVNSGTAPGVAYYASSGTAVSDGSAALINMGGVEIEAGGLAIDDGIMLQNTNTPCIYTNGTCRFQVGTTFAQFNYGVIGSSSNSYQLDSGNASGTNPTVRARRTDSDTGIGGAADGTMNIIVDATTIATVDVNKVAIASGKAFQLGNAYVNTPATPTGTLLITDSAGAVYKIPACLASGC